MMKLEECFSPELLILLNWLSLERRTEEAGLLRPEALKGLSARVETAAYYRELEGRPMDLAEKLALAVYLLIKEHPFRNGNKRTALKALVHALRKAGFKFRGSPLELARRLEALAASSPAEREPAVSALASFLRNNFRVN